MRQERREAWCQARLTAQSQSLAFRGVLQTADHGSEGKENVSTGSTSHWSEATPQGLNPYTSVSCLGTPADLTAVSWPPPTEMLQGRS